jgi:hypothetical protein
VLLLAFFVESLVVVVCFCRGRGEYVYVGNDDDEISKLVEISGDNKGSVSKRREGGVAAWGIPTSWWWALREGMGAGVVRGALPLRR